MGGRREPSPMDHNSPAAPASEGISPATAHFSPAAVRLKCPSASRLGTESSHAASEGPATETWKSAPSLHGRKSAAPATLPRRQSSYSHPRGRTPSAPRPVRASDRETDGSEDSDLVAGEVFLGEEAAVDDCDPEAPTKSLQPQLDHIQTEIERAWEVAAMSEKSTVASLEALERLRYERDEYKARYQRAVRGITGPGLADEDEEDPRTVSLKEEVRKLTTDRDELRMILKRGSDKEKRSRLEHDTTKTRLADCQQEIQQLIKSVSEYRSSATRLQKEVFAVTRQRDSLTAELENCKEALDQRTLTMKGTQEQLASRTEECRRVSSNLRDVRVVTEKLQKDLDSSKSHRKDLQRQLREKDDLVEHWKQDIKAMKIEVRTHSEEATKVREELNVLGRARDAAQRKIKILEATKLEAEIDRDSLRTLNQSHQRELHATLRDMEHERAQIDDLLRERDLLSRQCLKESEATAKQVSVVKLQEKTTQRLEQEIQSYKDEATKQRKLIFALEKERDRYMEEISSYQHKIEDLEQDISLRELQKGEVNKRCQDVEAKLKQQQALYEKVHAERSHYSKNLIEAQDQATDLKRRLRIMEHHSEQTKEDIVSKLELLSAKDGDISRLEKEKGMLKCEIVKLRSAGTALKDDMANESTKCKQLQRNILEVEEKRRTLTKSLQAVTEERNELSSQLVRRRADNAELTGKLELQEAALMRGHRDYQERVEDLRVIRLEMARLKREKANFEQGSHQQDDLKRSVAKLEKELTRERSKSKRLEEEMAKPVNVHRWRHLEGQDPAMFDLIGQLRHLQKRLISKSQKILDQEAEMLDLQSEIKRLNDRVNLYKKDYEKLKDLELARAEGEQRARQVQALTSELQMMKARYSDMEATKRSLSIENHNVKRRYMELRKRMDLLKRQVAQKGARLVFGGSHQRFVGIRSVVAGRDHQDPDKERNNHAPHRHRDARLAPRWKALRQAREAMHRSQFSS